MFLGEKPTLGHIRTFGTVVYSHQPTELRQKLDATSEKGILIGYDLANGQYRIYYPKTNKVNTSRDVYIPEVFDEELTKEVPNEYCRLEGNGTIDDPRLLSATEQEEAECLAVEHDAYQDEEEDELDEAAPEPSAAATQESGAGTSTGGSSTGRHHRSCRELPRSPSRRPNRHTTTYGRSPT